MRGGFADNVAGGRCLVRFLGISAVSALTLLAGRSSSAQTHANGLGIDDGFSLGSLRNVSCLGWLQRGLGGRTRWVEQSLTSVPGAFGVTELRQQLSLDETATWRLSFQSRYGFALSDHQSSVELQLRYQLREDAYAALGLLREQRLGPLEPKRTDTQLSAILGMTW